MGKQNVEKNTNNVEGENGSQRMKEKEITFT